MADLRHPAEPSHPEEGQQSLPVAQLTDPVRTVHQLPRFSVLGRLPVIRIDHALVFATQKGSHETFMPPRQPSNCRRYTVMYEVDIRVHPLPLSRSLPSDVDSFEFECTATSPGRWSTQLSSSPAANAMCPSYSPASLTG